ncbi:RNA polymerase sigma-70 factor (ECF subfamily) [Motilibacter rhizosphaerae]|uniref:RNA polymerase sigma-70 factor (ECF subfamily) n=1 Tax=Motilibacter rhizosphaerae TaxID=598652 RepID=A0A4Q7NSJ6_9ACTN|nr:sigma-70 family RNA polymerase sigma factor [Motilibacter rhizosphaerae]RZS90106.1 RNA polymerase sigma-70 factor (ECF subfamily) [Motilibacter rhizosphaerae]
MTELLAGPDSAEELEAYRRELTAYCYRMLGSGSEAEDAVQETLVKAWRARDGFEGRSSVRSWLYRIATNSCLDMLSATQRRARPMELRPSQGAGDGLGPLLPEEHWVMPAPDGRLLPEQADPAETVELRESVRLALVAALQHLPPRQRAVLILREVLQWPASEVAELLGTTVASVNSLLQRARATLGDQQPEPGDALAPLDPVQRELLERYAAAFEAYDMDALTALLHEDATMSMPPYDMWLQGPAEVVAWMTGTGHECEGSRLVPTAASGQPAYAQYRRSPDGVHRAWALQVVDVRDGRVTGITSFLDVAHLFPGFGLPLELPAD